MKKIFQFSLKRLIISIILSGIYLFFALISLSWNPLVSLDNKIMDGIYQHEGTAAPEIYIIGIDEDTISTYGNYNPLVYRQYFADILNDWADRGEFPTVVGFDVIFNESYGCQDVDLKLAEAMSRHNIILGVNGANRKDAPYGLSKTIYESSKQIGFTDALTDNDEAIRRVYLRGDNYDSLSYSIYKSYCDKKGLESINVDIKKDYYFKYYASPKLNHVNDILNLTKFR